MLKSTPALCILAYLLAHNLQAAQLTVTVHGIYDTATANFIASNGETSVNASSATPVVDYHTWIENYYNEHGEYCYVTHTDPEAGTERTEYQITVPDTWVGRSLTFSWDSGQTFTGYAPLFESVASYWFQSYYGNSPFWWGGQNNTGPMEVMSNRVLLGRWWNNSSRTLFALSTWDNADPNWPSMGMDFMASTPNTFWRWMHPSDNGVGVDIAMDLDHEHRLRLRPRNYTAGSSVGITLDPLGGVITVNGQQLMTSNYANSTFASRNLSVLGSGASSEIGGTALGTNASASGYYAPAANPDLGTNLTRNVTSAAIGSGASATTRGASAIGTQSKASGDFSIAVGVETVASGVESLAFGLKSEASNSAAIAIGALAKASGRKSIALGYRTVAQGYGQTVVGVNNVPVGNVSDPSDLNSEVFIVAGGSYEFSAAPNWTPLSLPRNSFTVKRGGDTTVSGSLKVNGAGQSVIEGSLKVNGVLWLAPQGDLSMGEFDQ